jgi:adenylate kinase family enzyme
MTESPIGRRIHVIGNSGSGKSTLGARLALVLEIPFVELDALNWEPGWIGLNEADPAEFERRIREATSGEAWVVAGSYSKFSMPIFWDRLQSVIWLDLPVPQLLWRTLARSWRRWRSKELLWGSNQERFWPHLKVWDKDSLVRWIITQQRRKRREMESARLNPVWSHVRFIRLASSSEVEEFAAHIEGTRSKASVADEQV